MGQQKSERKAFQLAAEYRRGEIPDDVLDAMAPQWTGFDAETIRHMAWQLDDQIRWENK